ncbi:MAG TPA: HAMP domain-containing methyl-accepting chemotaxis protein, partial [Rhodocyclaceae bacterium]|nr:HAMP domain-containing methyl-accepting chemotaxis protein [Rhodocyclaceae bacterium]
TRSITGPVTEAARVVGAIAQGDLRTDLHPQGRDEIASMMSGLQEMQVRLRDIAAIINASAGEVSSAAVELSATTGQVSQNVSHQSDAVASMSASVEEMSVSISTISDNATEARATSETSNNESTQGGEIILRAIEEIGRIANFVQESSAVIQNLQSKSTEISGIVNVIKEIADQTNLLALNAAIEAARAGEQGRGFAVVADEVRKLAERTTQSTQEISGMITIILDISSDAARGMDTGLALVESGTQLASEAGHSIERIQQSSTHAARIVNDISSSLTEQRSASESVAINIEKIAQMIEESNGAAKETANAANSLEALAVKLIETVSWFRTNKA